MRKVIQETDPQQIKQELNSLFAAIPYNNYVKNNISQYEGYYAAVMYTFFAALGFDLVPEDTTHRGRIDITLKTPKVILIFEFKVDSDEEPMRQIKEKKYYEKYLSADKDIYLIGIRFDSKERNIVDFVSEKFESVEGL